jgi:hypothetical protein
MLRRSIGRRTFRVAWSMVGAYRRARH